MVHRAGEQALLSLLHFLPLCVIWVMASILNYPPMDDGFGPVILSLRAEQWVGPPCVGSFMVLLGLYMRDWSEQFRAVLRFVGWATVGVTVFAFGVAGLWAPTVQVIFVYSLTTPLFVCWALRITWRDVRAAMEVRHV